MLNGLSLFSGIGGIDLGISDWVRTIAYCEKDPYCQAVLLSRMDDGQLYNAPIWDDITTFPAKGWGNYIDIIHGGFPCQDISVAGHGKGLAGERSGLFFEIIRLCRGISPKWIFLENVPAITIRGGREVVREITALGYDCRWCVISAASVGASHKRERWFLLAHSKHNGSFTSEGGGIIGTQLDERRQQQQEKDSGQVERTSCISSDVANSEIQGLERQWQISKRNEKGKSKPSSIGNKIGICNTNSQPSLQANTCTEPKQTERRTWGRHSGQHWPFESRKHWQEVVQSMGKCSDGLPYQVARLRALGNSCVPSQARKAFQILSGIDKPLGNIVP